MRVLFVTLFIVVLDQVTKLLVKGGTIPFINLKIDGMYYGQSFNVFGDFFKITFVENPGLAFGIDVNETSKLLLSIFTLIASIGIFFYLYKSREQKLVVRVALAFILGGAIGNLIDRTLYGVFYGYAPIFYGKVVDFFNFDFFDFTILGRSFDRWPIFNIADASVSVGVVLLLIFHKNVPEFGKEEKSTEQQDSDEQNMENISGDVNEIKSDANEKVINNMPVENGEDSNRKDN